MNTGGLRPPNIRRTVTIYCRYFDPATNFVRPLRRILTNVFYPEKQSTISAQTGVVSPQSAFYQVFSEPNMEYIPIWQWEEISNKEEAEALDGKWTVSLGAAASFIVPRKVDFEFNFMTPDQITNIENAFVNSTPGAGRIASIDDNRRGSPLAEHLYLRV